ncbi:thioredoxin domain-containing protein [Azospirillum melinis]|uniref:Thioredoxin domain-containing protein n=1 Tax=Azospirillum melinis TaxID=328839 RepID=A0ABX2KMI7_9PROT|nr:DsbA family protein [Azospirillum melinis]MBP2309528.1 protein-disulfide isomerase [Azospirillum melinis]NUB02696.1 thioredoxin domain-containing protein [Azospirillum melinis]
MMKAVQRLIVSIGLCVVGCGAADVGAQVNPHANLSPSAIDDQISKWVEAHPELVLKSINAYMASQQPNLLSFLASADVLIDSTLPGVGAKAEQADLTIVEFSDFNCHYCKEAENAVRAKIQEHKTIRVIYRDLGFLHPSSELAALAAKAADRQGKYHEYRAAVFAGQKQTGFTEDDLRSFAKQVGLDIPRWEADRISEPLKAGLKADMDLIAKLKIGGTPFFFGWVPSTKYGLISQGAVTDETLEAIIQDLRNGKAS